MNNLLRGLSSTIFLKKNGAGFTLIELLIVIGIMFVLLSASVPIYGSLQLKSQLNETSAQLVQNLRWARESSVSRYNNSTYGVFFDLIDNPNSYTIYQGGSYVSRDVSFDRLNILDGVIFIQNLSLVTTTENNIDINFSGGLGKPNNVGSFSLIHSVNNNSYTISINSLGKIED